MVLVSEITPPRHFGAISAMINVVFVVASAIGPVLGGAITTFGTWRCVPSGILVITIVSFIFPKVEGRSLLSFEESLRRVDWLGLMLCLGASIFIILPIQEGGTQWAWDNALTVVLICLGALGWVAFASWEFWLSRVPGERRFQAVNGLSPVKAGVSILPVLLVSAFGATVSGVLLSKRNLCSYFIIAANCLQLIGLGLLSSLPTSAPIPTVGYVYQTILGLGLGTALTSSFVLARIEVDRKDIAPTVGLITQLRVFGGVVGVVICRIAQSAYLGRHLTALVGPSTLAAITASVTAIAQLAPAEAVAVRRIYGAAFNWQWRILMYIAVANVPLALFTFRRVPKPLAKGPAPAPAANDVDGVSVAPGGVELETGRKQ
nr:efflux pump fus6 [Quercus suber]